MAEDNLIMEEAPEASPQQSEPAPETEQVLEELRAALEEKETALKVREEEVQTLREKLAFAVARYRALALASAPGVPEELVSGETVEEIDASLARARNLVEKIRRQVEAQAASARVPAGAPARSTPDLSGLSAAEKIAYGLKRGQP